MPQLTLRRQPEGKPVSAGIINACIDAVERLYRMRVGAGLASTSVAGIPLLRSTAPLANVRWVYTQSGGITYATSATSGTTITNTPASAMCWESSLNPTTGAWTVDTSIPAALKVYNDWTSATAHAGVAGSAWICVADADDGSTRCLGDPCP